MKWGEQWKQLTASDSYDVTPWQQHVLDCIC